MYSRSFDLAAAAGQEQHGKRWFGGFARAAFALDGRGVTLLRVLIGGAWLALLLGHLLGPIPLLLLGAFLLCLFELGPLRRLRC